MDKKDKYYLLDVETERLVIQIPKDHDYDKIEKLLDKYILEANGEILAAHPDPWNPDENRLLVKIVEFEPEPLKKAGIQLFLAASNNNQWGTWWTIRHKPK